MPKIEIDLDPTVLAHLLNASGNDTITISVKLGADNAQPAPVPGQTIPTGPLADLMKAGLIQPGTKLAFHQRRAKRTGRARVLSAGQIAVQGQSEAFWSPSKAAEAVTGNVINGWTLWRVDDGEGPTLDELRKRL
jgi:hypothetical protein